MSSSAASCPNCAYPINVEGADLVRALQARQEATVEPLRRWDWNRIINFRSRTLRCEYWAALAAGFVIGPLFGGWLLGTLAERDRGVVYLLVALGLIAVTVWINWGHL